jgi:hypothetical protein
MEDNENSHDMKKREMICDSLQSQDNSNHHSEFNQNQNKIENSLLIWLLTKKNHENLKISRKIVKQNLHEYTNERFNKQFTDLFKENLRIDLDPFNFTPPSQILINENKAHSHEYLQIEKTKRNLKNEIWMNTTKISNQLEEKEKLKSKISQLKFSTKLNSIRQRELTQAIDSIL